MGHIEINTTVGCRVDCDFCPQTLLMDKYSSQANIENVSYGNPVLMSFENFKTCLDKLPKEVTISFGGLSEPFLNPECSKMIVYAHESEHSISVFSTLVGMTLEDVKQLEHIPFVTFVIHLPDEPMYAKIAVNKNYIEVLKKLLSSNIKNIKGMTMGPLHPKIKEVLDTEIEEDVMISRAGNLENVKNNFKKKLGPLSCNIASKQSLEDKLDYNQLLPNGDVILCCNDYGLQNILGNLLESDYESLFHSEAFKKIREKMKSHDSDIICRNCEESIPESELIERRNIVKNYSGNSSANSLIQLYQNLLGRSPDKEGFDYFYSKISNGELTIQNVEGSIKESYEYTSSNPNKSRLGPKISKN